MQELEKKNKDLVEANGRIQGILTRTREEFVLQTADLIKQRRRAEKAEADLGEAKTKVANLQTEIDRINGELKSMRDKVSAATNLEGAVG